MLDDSQILDHLTSRIPTTLPKKLQKTQEYHIIATTAIIVDIYIMKSVLINLIYDKITC